MTRFGFFGRFAAGVGAAVAAPVARALAPVAPAIQPLGPYAMGVARLGSTTTFSGTWVGAMAEAEAATMPDLIQTSSYGSALADLSGAP
jgi:hypothetical protein